jgi:hypothetical protein
MIMQGATVSILCLMVRVSFLAGLMEKLELSFLKVEKCFGSSMTLIRQEKENTEESHAFVPQLIVNKFSLEDLMVN